LTGKEDKPSKQAFDEALKILARRDMSSSALLEKLTAKGFSREEAEEAAEKLRKKGYLDDSKLAGRQARLYLEKGKGYFYIKHHLHNLGFTTPPEVPAEDEIAAIIDILQKKGQTAKKLGNQANRVKMMVFLSRRGFRHDSITRAIRQFQETEG